MSDYDVTLKVEDFVEVEYNGERYAREVKLIGEEDVCRFLYYTGTLLKTGCGLHRHFFFYKYSNVFRKLCTPELVGTGDRVSNLKNWPRSYDLFYFKSIVSLSF